MSKKIVLITSAYPSANAKDKNFVLPELRSLVDAGLDITVMPIHFGGVIDKDFPGTAKISGDLAQQKHILNILRLILDVALSKNFYAEIVSQWKNLIVSPVRIVSLLKYSLKAMAVNRALARENPDIVYTYWYTGEAVGAVLYKRSKAPEVFLQTRLHGYDLYEERDCNRSYMPYRSMINGGIDRFVFLSEGAQQYFQSKYPNLPGQMLVSSLGVTANSQAVVKSLSPSEITFFSCSYASPVKRIPFIRDVVTHFAQLNPQIRIEWRHFGVSEDAVKAKALPSAPNLVCKLKGIMPAESFRAEYQETASSFFINMSLSEGQPVSIMEAMAEGLPVIATDVGGVREMVQDAGLLVSTDLTAAEVARQIHENLLNSALYLRMSSCALERQREYYDCNKNHNNLSQWLRKLPS